MKRTLIVILVSISSQFCYTFLHAQSLQMLRRSERVLGYTPAYTYHSEFEQALFTQWEQRVAPSSLALYMASDSFATSKSLQEIQKRLQEEIFSPLEDKKIKEKPENQQFNLIRNFVRKKYLKEYNLLADMEDLFTQQTFNNYTAVALYSLVLDHFEVPHEVWSNAIFVFLKFPLDNRVPNIEPIDMAYHPAPTLKQQSAYLEFLKVFNYIPNDSTRREGFQYVQDTYYQFFFPERKIYPHQLAGLLYYQKGKISLNLTDIPDTVKYVRNQFMYAQAQLEKAFLLYPDIAIQYGLYQGHVKAVGSGVMNVAGLIDHMVFSYQMEPQTFAEKKLEKTFQQITLQLFHQQRQDSLYEVMYQYWMDKLPDERGKEILNEVYFYEKARFFLSKKDYSSALGLFRRCSNWETNERIMPVVMSVNKVMEDLPSCKAKLAFLEDQGAIFPFLMEVESIKQVIVECE